MPLKLFRQVLRASASIPVAFNPVYIKVKAGGQEYDEMHVDGGVKAEVMLYEAALNLFTSKKKLRSLIPDRPRKLYIIRNAQVYPEYESIKPYIGDIGTRAISSLTKFQGVGDLYRIYVLAQRDGIDYNLAFIPKDFHPKRASEFDTKYMNEEFEMAYKEAHSGYKWHKYPPGFEPLTSHSRLSRIKAGLGRTGWACRALENTGRGPARQAPASMTDTAWLRLVSLNLSGPRTGPTVPPRPGP